MENEHSLYDFTEDTTHLTKMASNNWKEWLEVIENKLEKEFKSETNTPNAYHNFQFARILKKDILLFPLWTKILETTIDYESMAGSTASCEGEINNVKNTVLKI